MDPILNNPYFKTFLYALLTALCLFIISLVVIFSFFYWVDLTKRTVNICNNADKETEIQINYDSKTLTTIFPSKSILPNQCESIVFQHTHSGNFIVIRDGKQKEFEQKKKITPNTVQLFLISKNKISRFMIPRD
jgi:hypothetical protein